MEDKSVILPSSPPTPLSSLPHSTSIPPSSLPPSYSSSPSLLLSASPLRKIKYFFSYKREITVEPILFVYNMASQIIWISSQDLMIQKACKVNYGYPDWMCDNLDEFKDEEEGPQSLVSNFLMWRSILETAITVACVPLLGWWGDKYGHKWPLIVGLSALGMESFSLLLNSIFTDWPLEAILFGSFFYGVSGGAHGLLMLAFSFMAQRTTTGRRTLRIGILDGFYYLGSPIGLAIASPLFNSLGYKGVFTVGFILYAVAVAYALFRLPRKAHSEQSTDEGQRSCTDCGVDRLGDAFYTTLKPRPQKARRFILICIFAMLLDSFVIWGESNVKYLFTKRALDWDYSQYSHYGTVSSLMTVFGALVIIPVITSKTKLPDTLIGFIGAISRSSERVVYAFVTKPSLGWLMYAGSVLSIASPLCPIAIRSQISKLALEDVGQVYSVMAIGESLLPFIAAPIYNAVYEATLDTYPNAFYSLSIFANISMGVCFMYLFLAMRPFTKDSLNKDTVETSEEGQER